MKQEFKCIKCGLCCMSLKGVEQAKKLDDGREFANILIEKASYVLYMIHDLKFVMLKKVTNFLEIKFHIMNISN